MRARLLGLAFTFLAAGSLSAGTFTVTNTNDSGAGSLRQAILDSTRPTKPWKKPPTEARWPASRSRGR